MKDDKNNILLAIALTALILFGWPILYGKLFPEAAQQAAQQQAAAQQKSGTPGAAAPQAVVEKAVPLAQALSQSSATRIPIETPALKGSVNLVGARIDDLVLTRYKETLDKNSPDVRLFAPGGTDHAYFAGLGWSGQGVALPDANTVWTATGAKLTPATPVTLSWNNGQGQLFQIDLKVDQNYLFTATQKVSNTSANAVAITPYSFVNRLGIPKDPDAWTIHVGPMGVFDGKADYDINYDDVDEAGQNGIGKATTGGWIGFTDKYWLAAVIPAQNAKVNASVRASDGMGGKNLYQADYRANETIVAPGKVASTQSMIFAGAKENELLESYSKVVPLLDYSITWGWFWFFEKPIFKVLSWLFKMAGNFGVAIILLTFIVRGLMFPIAQKQFHSMAHMRIVQPKLKAIQEKYKDDKPRLQQEMMKIYKDEKINPFAGCLPILLQIPIFYALYKVLMLSIEMRHQPFVLWIKDLSAPDPMNLMTLAHWMGMNWFPSFLAIGILALLLGITMWLQFKLNPAQMDPVQQQIFSIMPWMMMFIMAPFAAGLLIYWITSNVLTIAQQKWLYSKYPQLNEPLAELVTHEGPKPGTTPSTVTGGNGKKGKK